MRPRLSSCRKIRAETVIQKNVSQLGLLSFLIVSLASICALVKAGDQIVFPSSNELSGGDHRPNRQQIYINPQPSTLSGRYQAAFKSQAERRPAPGGSPSTGASYQPPILRGPLSGPRPASGTTSSIGKSEESQVAEWPFFKSFKTIRNNQLINLQGQQTPPTSTTTTSTTTTLQANIQDATETTTEADLVDGGTPLESAATSQESSSTTSSPDGSMATERDVTTTETMPVRDVDLGEMMREVKKSITEMATTTTTTTTTTTAAPLVSDQSGNKAKADTNQKAVADQMLLMAPKMHSSIQKAVDQLVEMSASRANDATTSDNNNNNRPKAPTVMRLNGNSHGLKSSLSLNVLLKNFGAFNLSSLDQILLKSSLNEANEGGIQSDTPKSDSSRLSINGLHRLDERRPTTMATLSDNSDGQDETNGLGEQQAAAAECKIEYTMKHVNITLMNDDKSDYTCDYLIDRKLTKPHTSKGRICKLQLRSEFFSNESSSSDAERDAADTCAGSTHLSIGLMKFCLLEKSLAHDSSLDRVFNFPIENEAFDIKLVHRRAEKRRQSATLNSPGEIRLEIKPLADETCGREQAIQSNSTTRPTTTTTTTTTTTLAESPNRAISTTPKPASAMFSSSSSMAPALEPEKNHRSQLDEGNLRSASKPSQNFLIRTESERRQDKMKQTSDEINVKSKSTSKEAKSTTNMSQAPESKPMFKLINEQKHNGDKQESVCQRDSIHISTIGQIETPNYPNNYVANMRCRHVIKRVSRAHCKLLLHFRDFDLAPKEGPSPSSQTQTQLEEPCDGDYLQIGETRYCNKYAMMGHKMYLNFSEATTDELRDEAIAMTFYSDSKASGRGVLIKYQQLSCEQPPIEDTSKWTRQRLESAFKSPASSRPDSPDASRLQTLAPPLQQPDFSLAQKGEMTNRTGSGEQVASSQRGPRSKGNPNQVSGREQQKQVKPNRAEKPPVAQTMRQSAVQTSSLQMASTSTVATGNLLLADTPTTSASTLLGSSDDSSQSASNCNQVYNEMQFLLKSPNYPRPYDNNLNCVYYIRRNSSRVCYLELSLLSFQLEADSDCRYDSLEVNNVRLCGTLRQETTRIYMFEEAVKPIRFKTDASNPKAGFLIRAQQLECGLGGSILRHSTASSTNQPALGTTLATFADDGARKENTSALFEYDSPLSQSNQNRLNSSQESTLAGRSRHLMDLSSVWLQANENKPNRNQTSGQDSQQQSASSCDYLLHGSEITIRSPMWPESYASDDLLSSCRYTILRQNLASNRRNAVCQLELRFVHLRLGPGDCLDIDGMEVFCSFNARNLVKYYPFNERQTHLTVTFSTASGVAKLFTGRSAAPPYQHHTPLNSAQNHSDLLPTLRGPFRFMILARQLECVDDFLAPQVDLDQPATGAPTGGAHNQQTANSTNLLYTGELPPIRSLHLRPRYVNRTSSLILQPISKPTSALQPAAIQSKTDGNQLSYDQPTMAKDQITNLEPIPSRLNMSRVSSAPSGGVLMYSFANSIANNQNMSKPSSPSPSSSCLLQFNQYNGILASSNILKAQAEVRAGHSRLLPQSSVECEIRFKLLPGFCKVQLSFGEFDLYPGRRSSGNSLCTGEYLELAGVQYCGQELRGATRILSITLPGQRHISLRALQAGQNSFRGIFKQLECDQSSSPKQTILDKSQVDEQNLVVSNNKATPPPTLQSTGKFNSIDFREIELRDQFFELDSGRLSKESGRISYEPNMFIIYRLKRSHSSVCKLRLMFYKFDLEQAEPNAGCKRDFLDVNNQDRLCGTMDFRLDEASREYDWPEGSRDFAISFVSDGANERTGFHLFGQQVRCNRSEPAASNEALDHKLNGQPMPLVTVSTPLQGKSDESSRESYKVAGAPEVVTFNETKGKGENLMSQEHKFSKRLPANCSQIIDKLQFELASPGWPDRYDGTGSCHYLLQRAKSNICSVTLRVNSMILDIHPKASQRTIDDEGRCDGITENDSEDRLEIDQSVQLCGLMTRPRSYKFYFKNSTVERQFIVVKFISNQARGFGFLLDGQQNLCESAEQAGDQQQVEPVEDQKQQQQTKAAVATAKNRPEAKHQASDEDQPAYQISYDDSPRPREGMPPARQQQQQQADANTAKSCNRLLTGPFNLLESENFPDHYENNLDCVYAVRRLNQSVCAIDLVFNYFDLEPAASLSGSGGTSQAESSFAGATGGQAAQCDTDYLEVDYSRFCGAYPSQHKLRFPYFEHELDKILRFRSDAARTRIGFSISVSQVMDSNECEPSGIQTSDSLPEQKQRTTTTSVSRDHDSEREVISYLPDSTSALELAPTQSNESQRLPSATVCSFIYQNERQLLVSPGYNTQRNHYDNNLNCQYKIVAAGYEICSLRLTIIDLELERSSDCLNDYLLIDSRRYCGSMASVGSNSSSGDHEKNSPRPVIELEFDANLPREIDLILHTDSHNNMGRGFKISAEQLACDRAPSPRTTPTPTGTPPSRSASVSGGGGSEPAEQEFRLAEGGRNLDQSELAIAKARQLRRMRFGQLAYPKSYVSSGASDQPHARASPSDKTRATSGAGERAPPPGIESSSNGRAARARKLPHEAMFQTISSDDLRLSKDIVVGGRGIPASRTTTSGLATR